MSTSNERLYFDTLRRIARDYCTAEKLMRDADRRYGFSPAEALQMAYDNIQADAANAIRGKRRPVDKSQISAKVKREAARDMRADILGDSGNG